MSGDTSARQLRAGRGCDGPSCRTGPPRLADGLCTQLASAYNLVEGQYVPIEPLLGRLPSTVLGLHLERSGVDLRLFDPTTRRWLPTPRERAEAERERAEAERERAEREKAERTRIEAEVIRLREENESLRRRLGERS